MRVLDAMSRSQVRGGAQGTWGRLLVRAVKFLQIAWSRFSTDPW